MSDALIIKRGATLRLNFEMKTPAGVAQDLTGYTVSARILCPSTTLVLAVADVNRGAGVLALSATAVQTQSIPEGRVSRLVISTTAPGGDEEWETIAVIGVSP